VLVCAPSNAAVDEIVLRLVTHGVWNSLGGKMVPRVVRLGISTSPNPAVMAVTVDAKVEQFLSIKRVGSGQPNYAKITDLLARKEAMSAKILDAQVKLTSRTLMPSEQRSLEAEIDRLRVRREGIVSELFALQAQQRSVRKLRRISLTL
jgi:senataxin